MVAFGLPRERTAERDHRAHALRHHLGELARVETAEAPADQADLAAVGVVQLLHQIDHRVLHAMAQAEIAALAPAADGIAAALQEAAQRPRRGVGGDEPGQHQHRMTVAPRREAEQRQGAEKRAELVKWRAPPETSGFWTAGDSVWAATDIIVSSRVGPLRRGSRPLVQLRRRKRTQNRSATQHCS